MLGSESDCQYSIIIVLDESLPFVHKSLRSYLDFKSEHGWFK